MILTYLTCNLSIEDRERFLKYGVMVGNTIVVDAADLLAEEATVIVAIVCSRCGGEHMMDVCPISADTTPEIERNRAKQGGCCG